MSDRPPRTPSPHPNTPAKDGDPVNTLTELKSKLQEVASSRGRQYARYLAVLTYWELDNTNAHQDAQTMRTLLEACFAFDIVKVTMIAGNDPYPTWTVEGTIQELLRQDFDPKMPTLLVFYYAGHGETTEREFSLANKRQRILWSRLQQTIFCEAEVDFKGNLDCLAILDCCFGGRVSQIRSEQTTQILAASVGFTSGRGRGSLSFTQKIHRAAHSLRQYGPTVSMATLLQKIAEQSTTKKLRLITTDGTHPIVLTFKKKDQPKSEVPVKEKHSNEQHVLVKLTVRASQDAFRAFSDVIRDLPKGMAAEVTDAYETDSSWFCLLRMSWESYALWSMAAELELVGVTNGLSMVHNVGLSEHVAGPSHSECPLKD